MLGGSGHLLFTLRMHIYLTFLRRAPRCIIPAVAVAEVALSATSVSPSIRNGGAFFFYQYCISGRLSLRPLTASCKKSRMEHPL